MCHNEIILQLVYWDNGLRIKNPFEKLTLSVGQKQDKVAITQKEFSDLLKVISYENGEGTLPNGKRINYYYDWLPIAFRLAIETGLRGEELVTLRFSDIIELHKGVMAFKIVNLKVWRTMTASDPNKLDKYVKYVPITASLKRLLLECGLLSYGGKEKVIIPYPESFKHSYVMDLISRAFTHYISSVTKREIKLKDLRKYYITRITMALGNKAKLFTGHSDDAVIQRHYLADAALMGGMTEIDIFEGVA